MKVTSVDGKIFEIDAAELHRLVAAAGSMPNEHGNNPAGKYAAKTQEVMAAAQAELREATGDYPEDLEELYEFAAKHKLFGDREDTHIMCNFMKVFFGLMQKETHEA